MPEDVSPLLPPFYSQMVDVTAADLEGFACVEEAVHWQERGCGIASLRMVVEALNPALALPSYGALVRQGVELGAYCSRGWIHAGLVRLAVLYGVSGEAHRGQSCADLARFVESGCLCIASVSACFDPQTRGGHLIVVHGVRLGSGRVPEGFYVHHPSSQKAYNWQDKFVPLAAFERSFSGGLMVFGGED